MTTYPRMHSGEATARSVAHRGARATSHRRGFSLIELMTVLSISVLLAAMLMPVIRTAHENVQRVVSASNLRQIGLGVTMYADDHGGHLPYSRVLEKEKTPRELMVVRAPLTDDDSFETNGWDGLGRLYSWSYVPDSEVFYAPSHRGEHAFVRYEDAWLMKEDSRIYCNYHYAGHREWDGDERVRRLGEGQQLVLATDGLRTRGDLNHRFGMNALRADGSVVWTGLNEFIRETVPYEPVLGNSSDDPFLTLWTEVEALVYE